LISLERLPQQMKGKHPMHSERPNRVDFRVSQQLLDCLSGLVGPVSTEKAPVAEVGRLERRWICAKAFPELPVSRSNRIYKKQLLLFEIHHRSKP
jgi:hypothetical protein